MNITAMNRKSIINYQELWERIKVYALKAGRVAARPVLLLYYVMASKDTPRKDKMIVFGALAYLILPFDLLDAKRLPVLGWLDEIASLAVAIQKMGKYITPEMETKVDDVLDRWLPEYIDFVEVNN